MKKIFYVSILCFIPSVLGVDFEKMGKSVECLKDLGTFNKMKHVMLAFKHLEVNDKTQSTTQLIMDVFKSNSYVKYDIKSLKIDLVKHGEDAEEHERKYLYHLESCSARRIVDVAFSPDRTCFIIGYTNFTNDYLTLQWYKALNGEKFWFAPIRISRMEADENLLKHIPIIALPPSKSDLHERPLAVFFTPHNVFVHKPEDTTSEKECSESHLKKIPVKKARALGGIQAIKVLENNDLKLFFDNKKIRHKTIKASEIFS